MKDLRKFKGRSEYSQVGSHGASHFKSKEWWLQELGAWFGSALLLMCVVVLLNVYDDKPRPTLKGGITLNALIAVIIRVGLALLVVPLSSAVGQWKWVRVRTDRSLAEFAGISDAAHSPWGSISLIFRLRGGIMAVAGALLVISMQGIETFVQQSVKYPPGLRQVDSIATLPITDYFRSQASVNGLSLPPDFDMKAAVYNGLFADGPDKPYPVTPACSGAKCTWTTYHTLALCNSCTNITDQIKTNAADTKHTLPDGLSLRTVDSYGQVLHRYNATVKDDPESDISLVLTFLAVWLNESFGVDADGNSGNTVNAVPTAGRCTFQLCVKKMDSAEFSNGQLEEKGAPDATNALGSVTQDTIPESDLSFRTDYLSWEGFRDWLDTLISGTYTATDDFGETYNASADSRDAVFQVMTNSRGSLTLQSLFDNVANSLTRTMRTNHIEQDESVGPSVDGSTYANATIVKVDWAWLSFPFAIWALILLYTITIITMSGGVPSWKDQTIATLCHGLDGKAMEEVARIQGSSDMEAKARALYVRLVETGSSSKLEAQSRQGASIPLTESR